MARGKRIRPAPEFRALTEELDVCEMMVLHGMAFGGGRCSRRDVISFSGLDTLIRRGYVERDQSVYAITRAARPRVAHLMERAA